MIPKSLADLYKKQIANNYVLKKAFESLWFLIIAIALLNHFFGIYNKYTPIPFWDAWVSYAVIPDLSGLTYFEYFFSRHNGSHILLTHRITEIVDWKLFSGAQIFTTISLGVCPIILAWLYIKPINRSSQNIFIVAIVLGLMLSWVQWENFRWPFQDQMYFVLIFAYIAIRCKEKYLSSGGFLYIAFYFGSALLAIFSMGNGVLASLSCAMISIASILIFKTNRRRNFYVLLVTGLCLGIWFSAFHGGGTGIPPRAATDILEVLYSTLALIGSPLHIVFNCKKIVSAIAGMLILLAIGYFSWRSFYEKKSQIYISYMAFLTASCLIAIYARYIDFPNAWETSRYQGITMSIWALTFVEFINSNVKNKKLQLAVSFLLVVFVLASIIKFHRMQYENLSWEKFEKSMGVLSLLKRVDDPKELNTFFPWFQEITVLTNRARESCSGVFANKLFKDACSGKFATSSLPAGELGINLVKYEEVDNVYRLFGLIECPAGIDSVESAIIISQTQQINIFIGKDTKNFGDNCRVGGYFPNAQSLSDYQLVVDKGSYRLKEKK
jgi:hypothetical protein